MITSLQLQSEEGRRIGIFLFYHKTLLDKTSNVVVHYSSSSEGLFVSLAFHKYLTINPRARMGYESIAHEAEGRMGY